MSSASFLPHRMAGPTEIRSMSDVSDEDEAAFRAQAQPYTLTEEKWNSIYIMLRQGKKSSDIIDFIEGNGPKLDASTRRSIEWLPWELSKAYIMEHKSKVNTDTGKRHGAGSLVNLVKARYNFTLSPSTCRERIKHWHQEQQLIEDQKATRGAAHDPVPPSTLPSRRIHSPEKQVSNKRRELSTTPLSHGDETNITRSGFNRLFFGEVPGSRMQSSPHPGEFAPTQVPHNNHRRSSYNSALGRVRQEATPPFTPTPEVIPDQLLPNYPHRGSDLPRQDVRTLPGTPLTHAAAHTSNAADSRVEDLTEQLEQMKLIIKAKDVELCYLRDANISLRRKESTALSRLQEAEEELVGCLQSDSKAIEALREDLDMARRTVDNNTDERALIREKVDELRQVMMKLEPRLYLQYHDGREHSPTGQAVLTSHGHDGNGIDASRITELFDLNNIISTLHVYYLSLDQFHEGSHTNITSALTSCHDPLLYEAPPTVHPTDLVRRRPSASTSGGEALRDSGYQSGVPPTTQEQLREQLEKFSDRVGSAKTSVTGDHMSETSSWSAKMSIRSFPLDGAH